MFKKLFVVLLCFAAYSLYAQKPEKIRILGTDISQKDLCVELGEGKFCNPFPYGGSVVLNKRRWVFPSIVKGDTLDIVEISKKYIGGLFVNKNLPVMAEENIQNHYETKNFYDIHSSSISLTLKDSILKTLDFNASIENIISALKKKIKDDNEQISNEEEKEVKESLKNYFSRKRNEGIEVNLVYHSIKLNGNWYRAAMDGDLLATKILNIENVSPIPGPLSRDSRRFISGMGIIEYSASISESFDKDLRLNTGKIVSKYLELQLQNQLQRSLNSVIPSKYDLLIVSYLPKIEYFKSGKEKTMAKSK